ncbi:pancreatic lipase-related protein 2-like [Stegodyphus dumicola]|uniref:pancreatic lipase-related protein 2-like n=1 Tax=Stegodyphus dumicola TaxID=202533 RepID=UPI0015B1AE72|nr:pancreatic lipase-related protein 2-like [Stegodyphus dumicola]XP_035216471.1 pancreatic lipase-related protein 2-like [Stegodyphus dumicola]
MEIIPGFLSHAFVLFFALNYGSASLSLNIFGWQSNPNDTGREICMKDLGCFSLTSDFISFQHRPISILPNDRSTINTRFLLFTKKNAKEEQLLVANNAQSINDSYLDPEKPVKFIVHGFMDSQLYGPWMVNLKDELLMYGDYNIIIVDWSGGNLPPYYQATSNTRVVGAEIAFLLKALNNYKGIQPENCHIIGHSLGAHVAGYAGQILGNLGRITGCDPAEPYFQNMPASVRLDPTDADFVDVIHSDSTDIMFYGFGMSHKVGHVDFYPNNGRNQPGCETEKFISIVLSGITEGARRFVSCNHQRSLDFLHYSINYKKVTPVGYECTSWEDFLAGKCAECGPDTKKCAIMGIRADEYKKFRDNSVQHAMYLKTSALPPYWLYHYHVSVKLFKPHFSYKDYAGTFSIGLYGSKEDDIAKVQDRSIDLIHGETYEYIMTTSKELGEVRSVTMKWGMFSLNPINLFKKPKLYVEYITVVPMNTIEKSPRNMTDRVFCGNPNNPIEPGDVATFHKDNTCLVENLN